MSLDKVRRLLGEIACMPWVDSQAPYARKAREALEALAAVEQAQGDLHPEYVDGFARGFDSAEKLQAPPAPHGPVAPAVLARRKPLSDWMPVPVWVVEKFVGETATEANRKLWTVEGPVVCWPEDVRR